MLSSNMLLLILIPLIVTFSTPTGHYTQNPNSDCPLDKDRSGLLPRICWERVLVFQTPCSVKSRFARHSVYDRWSFASGVLESRTAHCGSREKPGNRGPACRAVRSLRSGLSANNRGIRASIAYFKPGGIDFLCGPDCVAERETFEPSVQV